MRGSKKTRSKKPRRAKARAVSKSSTRTILSVLHADVRAYCGEIFQRLCRIEDGAKTYPSGFSDRLAGIEANINALHASYVNLEAMYRGSRPVVDNPAYRSIKEKLDSSVASQKLVLERQTVEINSLKLQNAELSALLGPMCTKIQELNKALVTQDAKAPAVSKKVKRR